MPPVSRDTVSYPQIFEVEDCYLESETLELIENCLGMSGFMAWSLNVHTSCSTELVIEHYYSVFQKFDLLSSRGRGDLSK